MIKSISAINLYSSHMVKKSTTNAGPWEIKYVSTFFNWSSAIFHTSFYEAGDFQLILPYRKEYKSLFDKTQDWDFFLLEIQGEMTGQNHTIFIVDSLTIYEENAIQYIKIEGWDLLGMYQKMGFYRFEISTGLGAVVNSIRLKTISAINPFEVNQLFYLALCHPVRAYRDTDTSKEIETSSVVNEKCAHLGCVFDFWSDTQTIEASSNYPYYVAPYNNALDLITEIGEKYYYGVLNTSMEEQTDGTFLIKVRAGVGSNYGQIFSKANKNFENPSVKKTLFSTAFGGRPMLIGQEVPSSELGKSSGENFIMNDTKFLMSGSPADVPFERFLSIGKELTLIGDQKPYFEETGVKPCLENTNGITVEITSNSSWPQVTNVLYNACKRKPLVEKDVVDGTIIEKDSPSVNTSLGAFVKIQAFDVEENAIITDITYYSDSTGFSSEIGYKKK